MLSGLIPVIHGTDLWNRHVRLINDDQIIILKIIHQCHWCLARRKPVHMAGIILYTGAKACLHQHFYIKIRPFRNTLCL